MTLSPINSCLNRGAWGVLLALAGTFPVRARSGLLPYLTLGLLRTGKLSQRTVTVTRPSSILKSVAVMLGAAAAFHPFPYSRHLASSPKTCQHPRMVQYPATLALTSPKQPLQILTALRISPPPLQPAERSPTIKKLGVGHPSPKKSSSRFYVDLRLQWPRLRLSAAG